MDLSKLSDDELIALKQGDYTKLSNESLLALKGSAQSQQQESPGMMKQVWDGLAKPAEMSKEGLNQIAEAIPADPVPMTGNMLHDVGLNAPFTAAKSVAETAAKVAPGMISRGAILTAGALKGVQMASEIPAVAKGIGAVGQTAAKYGEKLTGIKADKIASLFEKPLSIFTAPSEKQVQAAYSKSELQQAEKTLNEVVESGTASYASHIKKAGKALLTASPTSKEATGQLLLKGRKALDKQIGLLESQANTAKDGKSAIKEAIRDKMALRTEFNKALDVIAPKHRAADAAFAAQAKLDPFRKALLPGKFEFTSPSGILNGVPGAPQALGGGIAAAGGVTQAAKGIVNNAGQSGAALGMAAYDKFFNKKKRK